MHPSTSLDHKLPRLPSKEVKWNSKLSCGFDVFYVSDVVS